jgi:hypothetical protein
MAVGETIISAGTPGKKSFRKQSNKLFVINKNILYSLAFRPYLLKKTSIREKDSKRVQTKD